MGFLSDIVRDSRPRPTRAPEGGGADSGMLPLAEPLGMLGGGPSVEQVSEPTVDSPGDPHRARFLPPPTIRDRAADPPGPRGPGYTGAPAEAGEVEESPHGVPSPFSPSAVEGGWEPPEGQAGEPAEPRALGEDAGRGVLEGAEGAVESRTATDASPARMTESATSPPAVESEDRRRRRRAGIEPRASARGPEGPITPTSERTADSPAGRAPGSGDAPAEAGGVAAHLAESSSLTPAAGETDRQRQRRAGGEPRASARGPGGPITPQGPEGAEDGPPAHELTADSPGLRDPTSRQAAAQSARESPLETGVPKTVARPLGLPGSPSDRRRRTDTARDPEALPPVETFRGSRRRRAAAEGNGGPSADSEREIPVVEAVSRPTAPPRPLPALRGGEAGAGPGTRQRPSREPEGPRVHIGQVDVLVQAPPEPRTASKPERRSTGLTSRLYLRRL